MHQAVQPGQTKGELQIAALPAQQSQCTAGDTGQTRQPEQRKSQSLDPDRSARTHQRRNKARSQGGNNHH